MNDIFLKIGFAEIPYINKGLLVYLVFSMGMGVNIPWVRGVDIPWVYRPPYPWYIDPPTNGILTPLPYAIIDF